MDGGGCRHKPVGQLVESFKHNKELGMRTLQKTVAAIRTLECEEIDLVSGGVSIGTESTMDATKSTFSYVTGDGHSGTVSAIDDMVYDGETFAYD